MIEQGIIFGNDINNFSVRFNAATRDFSDYRTELNNDALTIKNQYGSVNVLFSSGVDSQVIARTFLDMKVDTEFIFLNYLNHSVEMEHVLECERFFGIKVKVIDIDVNKFKHEWINRSKNENPAPMHHYPFEWLSKNIDNDFPIITQGSNEPAIVGTKEKVSIYCNHFEGAQRRFRLMQKYRTVLDFPFSPEAVSSYYTDDIMKSFAYTMQYFAETNLSRNNKSLTKDQYWNCFAKPILKGKYFKNELIWYGKMTGYEKFPDWVKPQQEIKETRVSVPYWDLVNFLENNRSTYKEYSDWIYSENTPGFVSLGESSES